MWFQTATGLLLVLAPCLSLHTLRTEEPTPPTPVSRRHPVLGWVDVRLNHFMAYNTDTFQMRYYYNDEFGSQHVVIFVGGEWEISQGWTTGGLAYEIAQRLGAGLFYTEHRYYGQSRPFSETSVPNLRFLSIDQALADLAQFIEHVKSEDFENGRYRNAAVVLVGCSYAGTMATWMRLAYPHLVTAAFSDSGPLLAQEDFPEYLETVSTAIREQGGEECLSSIEESMERLVELLATPDGPAAVSQMFDTCTTISTSEPLDMASFFIFGITTSFSYLVQYARPGDIPTACEELTNSAVYPVQRLANWITARNQNICIETRYQEVVAQYTNTSVFAPAATMRLWLYQTCVEFGWYQTTTGSNHPFLATVPLEYYHQICKDIYSTYFDENILRSGIERTNLFFGGGHLPDRVVTVLGGHDPWTPMGPNVTDQHPLAPVHLVSGISHCRAIENTGSTDNVELEEVKALVMNQISQFVFNDWPAAGASSVHASIVLLVASIAYCLI